MFDELKNKIIDLMREEGRLLVEFDEAIKKREEYFTYKNSPNLEKRWIYFNEDYSRLSSFFGKEKYDSELKRMYQDIQSEYSQKYDDISNRINEINRQINVIKQEIAKLMNDIKQNNEESKHVRK